VAADKAQQQSGDERCDGDAERGPSRTSPRPARSTAPHFDHVSIIGSVRRSPQPARNAARKTLTVRGRFHLLTIDRGVVHWPAVCAIWTAIVLLAAVTIDTAARRSQTNR